MERVKGNIARIVTAAAWGTAIFPLQLVSHNVSPLVIVAIRYLLAATLLGGYLAWRRQPLLHGISRGVALGALLFLFAVTITWGASHTPALTASFLQETRGVLVPLLLLLFYGTRLSRRTLLGMAITLLGVYVLVGIPHATGQYVIVGATLLSALQIIVIDRAGHGEYPYVFCFQQLLVTGLLATIAALVTRQSLALTPTAVGVLLYLSIVPTLLGYFLQSYGQRLIRADRASLLLNLAPVFTLLLSLYIQPLLFNGQIAAGLALVMLAVILGELRHLPHLKTAHVART